MNATYHIEGIISQNTISCRNSEKHCEIFDNNFFIMKYHITWEKKQQIFKKLNFEEKDIGFP